MFSQNTGKSIYSYAKYSLKFYGKYRFFNKMLRKIQDILLQNTGFSGKCFAKYSDKLLRLVFAKYRLFEKYNKPFQGTRKVFQSREVLLPCSKRRVSSRWNRCLSWPQNNLKIDSVERRVPVPSEDSLSFRITNSFQNVFAATPCGRIWLLAPYVVGICAL